MPAGSNRSNDTKSSSHRIALELSLVAVALALVAIGAFIPAFRLEALIGDDQPVSIFYSAIEALRGGSEVLGAVILLFSVLFPLVKLLVLGLLEIRSDVFERRRALELLELLGKWSMLDVLIIATLVGTIRLGIFTQAEAEPGVYVFFTGILLSLILTARSVRRHAGPVELRYEASPLLRAFSLLTSLLALLCLGVAIALPIAEVEKWVIGNTFHLLVSSLEMIAAGEFLLPLVLFAFVVAIPVLRLLLLIACHLQGSPSAGLLAAATRVGAWSMLDVYLLALLLVSFKLGEVVELEPAAGIYFLTGAALLERAAHYLSGLAFRDVGASA